MFENNNDIPAKREMLAKKGDEAFRKSVDLWNKYCEKKAELEVLVHSWLNNESEMNDAELEQLINKMDAEVAELKELHDSTYEEYKKTREDEALLEKALMSVKLNLGISPEEIIITGGVASSNSSETHLDGRFKTPEELEIERQRALAMIREKVVNKEITLEHASRLKNNVNIAYGYEPQTQDTNKGPKM